MKDSLLLKNCLIVNYFSFPSTTFSLQNTEKNVKLHSPQRKYNSSKLKLVGQNLKYVLYFEWQFRIISIYSMFCSSLVVKRSSLSEVS